MLRRALSAHRRCRRSPAREPARLLGGAPSAVLLAVHGRCRGSRRRGRSLLLLSCAPRTDPGCTVPRGLLLVAEARPHVERPAEDVVDRGALRSFLHHRLVLLRELAASLDV